MIKITILDNDESFIDIHDGEVHWSNLFEFNAILTFAYGDNGKCEFETMHHFMLIESMCEGILNLLLQQKQSSYSDFGKTSDNKLAFKIKNHDVNISVHPPKGENTLAKTTPKVLALDFLRVLKNLKKLYLSYRMDDLCDTELKALDHYFYSISKALNKIS
ncbi:hypothetical protein ABE042_11420 [Viridibacillus arvi]|uniref:hypothetical protein n=1 Tax=Viridibacillus arvi TaxID=263475 RepID=UPI003D07DA1B